jgi:hypothetical protein
MVESAKGVPRGPAAKLQSIVLQRRRTIVPDSSRPRRETAQGSQKRLVTGKANNG